ncbi:MAG TPA: PilW family protein [Candidatus Deferrimicrobiaceae bacterium]|nr:PilW family protein [Candidatus Deferrimicrobiaceae bacterium]
MKKRLPILGKDGFSLIEVMIALLIVAFSMTAIFASFNFQQKSYLAQNAVAEMQQNVRGAVQFFEMDARNAGFGIPSHVLYKLPALLVGGTGSIVMVSGLGVLDGGASGTDNVYTIYLSATATELAASMPQPSSELKVVDAGGWQAGDIAIIFDDTTADVFQVTAVQASNHLQHNPQGLFSGSFSKAYGEGSTVAKISYAGYYIDTSDPAHPTLTRNILDNTGNFVPQIVADDIEDFQVRLVLENGSEYDPDYFLTAPGDAQRGNVREMRVYIMGRTRTAEKDWNEGPIPKWNRTSVASLAPYNKHRRRSMEMVIDLRNSGIAP